jgi:nitrogen-specific signal transduction histidine kinase
LSDSSPASPGGSSDPATADLVLALCHEIGNLVGAVRLQAHLLDGEMSPRELARASLDVDDLCARSAALLAHVRPLLAGPSGPVVTVSPGELVRSVRDLMARHAGPGVRLVAEEERDLPELAVDRAMLHHLLQSLAFGAIEAAAGGGTVRLVAERHDGAIAFGVEDDGPVGPEPEAGAHSALRGRPLVQAVARRIAGRAGGQCEVSRSSGRTRVSLVWPADGRSA